MFPQPLDSDENEKTIKVKSEPFINWAYWSFKPVSDRLPTSMNIRKPNFQLHIDRDVLDLEMNALENNSENNTISQLSRELDSILIENETNRLTIDLRNNTGGNNQLYDPIIETIQSHSLINQKERLFVLTGRTIFSAGVNFVDDLKFETNATLVGEPTDAGANHYGDANRLVRT